MKPGIDWKTHLIRFFFVTLGVFIAFGLNTCNERRKEKLQIKLYLQGLQEELLENQTKLNTSLPYHQELLTTLRQQPEKANLIMNPAAVSNVAWNLADNEVFKKYVDHELYKQLSTVYQFHESLLEQHRQASNLMSELNVLGPLHASSLLGQTFTEEQEIQLNNQISQGWIPIFETWTSLEQDYLQNIENALAMIDRN
ncbi:MAG: hypothetical protein AAF587_10715 [Bacteroidota bacterium]